MWMKNIWSIYFEKGLIEVDVDVNEGFRKQMPQIENENIIWCDVTTHTQW